MQHPTILVVDEDVHIVAAFAEFCRRESYDMMRAASTDEARRKCGIHKVDLLICDLTENSPSAKELLRYCHTECPNLRTIAITGYPERIRLEELTELGVDGVLQKPLDLDLLRSAVHNCLPPA